MRAAARRGCPCPGSAYRSLGCQIQCGSCHDYVAEIIDEERSALLATGARAA